MVLNYSNSCGSKQVCRYGSCSHAQNVYILPTKETPEDSKPTEQELNQVCPSYFIIALKINIKWNLYIFQKQK